VEANNKMLVQGSPKLKRFIEAIEKRISFLKQDAIDEIDELSDQSKP